MKIQQPITFEKMVTITYDDGTTEGSNQFPGSRGQVPCRFDLVNGEDLVKNRITNLVGYDGLNLLKFCPNCEEIKDTGAYGAAGRITNGKRRDQSWCKKCRQQ